MKYHKAVAAALKKSREIADQRGAEIIKSSELGREERELLNNAGWLHEIIKGWYTLVRPDVAEGDSTAWYANFWDFLRVYLDERFGEDYCLTAESSLDLHLDVPFIPRQIIVLAKKGGTVTYQLPFDTSILIYEDPKKFPDERVSVRGLQAMTLAYALCKVGPAYFQKNSDEAEIALRLVQATDVNKILLRYEMKTAAERIAGAYQFLGYEQNVEDIVSTMATISLKIIPKNPFEKLEPVTETVRPRSPYAARIEALWSNGRRSVIDAFPTEPGCPKELDEYMQQLEDIYEHDAYNSLSIEGYKVSKELIERVMNNEWDPENSVGDSDQKNALAARGYYEAFNQVKESIKKIIRGENSGEVLSQDFQLWYRNLFAPSVRAGILTPERLVGYREDRVFIRNSRHTPPPKDAVVDTMETLFNCIKRESHAAVRAILGHYILVFIHPYMDGNGRMARFLMNVMFASGGYNWTVLQMKNRRAYMQSLGITDETKDFAEFTKYIAEEMAQSEEFIKEL